jgi:hypothetical protein
MLACSLMYPTDRSTSSASVLETYRRRQFPWDWYPADEQNWQLLRKYFSNVVSVKYLAALIPSKLTLVASLVQSSCSCCLHKPTDGGWPRHTLLHGSLQYLLSVGSVARLLACVIVIMALMCIYLRIDHQISGCPVHVYYSSVTV